MPTVPEEMFFNSEAVQAEVSVGTVVTAQALVSMGVCCFFLQFQYECGHLLLEDYLLIRRGGIPGGRGDRQSLSYCIDLF